MLLFELFTNPLKYTIVRDEPSLFVATFDDQDDNQYRFIANESRTTENVWAFSFGYIDKSMYIPQATYEPTGLNTPIPIFSTVAHLVMELIKKHNPNAILFSSVRSEGTRVKLYTRMAKKLAQTIGFEVSIRSEGTFVGFVLSKPGFGVPDIMELGL